MQRFTYTVLTLTLTLALATTAAADIYRYRTPEGRWVITNTPPPAGTDARTYEERTDGGPRRPPEAGQSATPHDETPSRATPTTSVDAEEATQGFCADRWPNDFTMQASCTNRQYRAILAVEQRMKHAGAFNKGSKAHLAWRTCMDRWKAPLFDTFDWVMVDSCFERQLQALGQLGR